LSNFFEEPISASSENAPVPDKEIMLMPMLSRRATILAAGASLVLAPRLAFATAASTSGPAVGAAAPDFSLPDQDGTVRRLSEFRGRAVVLEWTNHDCPYVRNHYNSGNMQSLQRDAQSRGIVWLSMASSPVGQQGHVTGAQARQLTASRNAAPTAVILDPRSQASRAYRARTTPHMFIVAPDGTLAYMGGIDSIRSTRPDSIARAEPYVRNAMLAVAEGRRVERAVTEAYGCVVHYADAST
jgi:peroxiredoxin